MPTRGRLRFSCCSEFFRGRVKACHPVWGVPFHQTAANLKSFRRSFQGIPAKAGTPTRSFLPRALICRPGSRLYKSARLAPSPLALALPGNGVGAHHTH